MSTAREIEEAIRTLPSSERDKLLRHIPACFLNWPATRSGNDLSGKNDRAQS